MVQSFIHYSFDPVTAATVKKQHPNELTIDDSIEENVGEQDSIEEYVGEKVAFYFTWLQHTASHLVFLSVPGHILFVLMFANHDFLHPLQPLFSIMTDKLRAVELEEERIAHITGTENM